MKKTYKIYPSKKGQIKTFDELPSPCVYSPAKYGLKDYGSGEGVSISIIDSGKPSHKDIKNIIESVDLSNSNSDNDFLGHATMISGIIGASNKDSGIFGLATSADLYFPKVVNAGGLCSYDALLAAVLWSIVKNVDIILISLGSEIDHAVLYDAIKKAYENGIVVISSSGDDGPKFPASYKEVLSVGRTTGKTSADAQLVISDRNMKTTYLNNRYTKASGTSLTAAVGAGLAALIIEQNNKSGKDISPSKVYKELSSLK